MAEGVLNFSSACEEFESLLDRLDLTTASQFKKWLRVRINDQHDTEKVPVEKNINADKILRSIADDLRGNPNLPTSAVVETEKITHPICGEFADTDTRTLVHVDKFLYEDDDSIDDLCEQGMLSRNYCQDCGSHKTAPLTFISHSASVAQVKFVFQHLLPDLSGKTVIDVGSRLGAFLYGAYHYSSASSVIGIEMNNDLCLLQEEIIQRYAISDRIQVICADILNRPDVLEKADVVILHNVFEFFLSVDQQRRIWQYIHQMVRKKGCFLVTVPSMEQSWDVLELPLNLEGWVEKLPVDAACSDFDEDEKEDICSMHLYQVT